MRVSTTLNECLVNIVTEVTNQNDSHDVIKINLGEYLIFWSSAAKYKD
jgi:hypothetical protein